MLEACSRNVSWMDVDQIIQAIEDLTDGKATVSKGTVYSILKWSPSFEQKKQGNQDSRSHKYFIINQSGLEELDDLRNSIKEVVDLLNNRPRKKLNYKTPNEVMGGALNS